jgi:subtilisin family serine protease
MNGAVRVAIVDSGWDVSSDDDRVDEGISFVGDEDPLTLCASAGAPDRIGHGTACTDIVLRMAPTSRILPVRVFSTRLETSPEVLVAALDWLSRQRCPVINVSLGSARRAFAENMYLACDKLRQNGSIVIASAGKMNPGLLPAAFDNVIAVGAGVFETPSDFRWSADAFPECVASGGLQEVRGIAGKRYATGGSSFAAAHISGIIARLLMDYGPMGIGEIRAKLAERSLS